MIGTMHSERSIPVGAARATRAALVYHCGGGSADEGELDALREALQGLDLELLRVENGAHPGELARDAIGRGATLVIAAGGDGTVSAVASAVLEADDACLGILPRGTANSIAAHLGIPSDLASACEILMQGEARRVDAAEVNGRTMLLMATVGVHADAVIDAPKENKRALGALAYALEELSRMAGDTRFEAELEADGQRFRCFCSALTVANLAPPSSLPAQGCGEHIADDGLLEVTVLSFDGLSEALITQLHLATRALTGAPADRENVASFRAQHVRIHTPEPRRVMVDGEHVGDTPIEVRCLPRKLKVMVPRSGDAG